MKRTLPYLKTGIFIYSALLVLISPSVSGQVIGLQQISLNSFGSRDNSAQDVLVNFTWTGNTSGEWEDPANWQNGVVPDENSDVIIFPGTPNSATIRNVGVCNSLIIHTGASLTVQNGGAIAIYSTITKNGTFTVDGVLSLQSTGTQQLPGGVYGTISIKAGGTVVLDDDVTISNQLLLTNGYVKLGSKNLVIDNSGLITGGNAGSFIITDGTGYLKQNAIGRDGRSDEVFFPIGNSASSYNPLWITNRGNADGFSARVQEGIFSAYSGNTPTGGPVSTHTVNRTWYLDEDLPGNSQVDLRVQWYQSDENANFARGNAFIGRYENSMWDGYAASPASGGDPFTIVRANITSFSPFGVFDQLQLLPVKISAFYANLQNQNVLLQWKTSSEFGSNRFEVERSANGTNFQAVGTVTAAGNSNEIKTYAFTDLAPFQVVGAPTLFYRLRHIDVTGQARYSDVLRVSESMKGNGIKVSPNPFTNQIKIQFNATKETEVTFTVTDMAGSVVKQVEHMAGKGVNIYTWNELDKLPMGKYLLIAEIGGQSITTPILKK